MPDRLMRAALGWFALMTVAFWLPVVRGACDGPSYQWGLAGLGGSGVRGDYWFPVAGSCAALAIRAGYRRYRHWAFDLVAAWSVLLFVAIVVIAVSSPDGLRIQGDTLGIDISLAWAGPVLFGTAAVLSLIAARRAHQRSPTVPVAWLPLNARWLAVLSATVPIQFVLLRFGRAGSVSDQLGVLLTVAQWLVLDRVFRPFAG